jgi:DNA polymerase
MSEKILFDLLAPGSRRFLRPVFSHTSQQTGAGSGAETLDDLAAEAADCSRCVLRNSASQVVFGQGNPRAALMFIGEGPGAEEDKQGQAFVGAAGQLLDKILAAIDLSREEVYIANIVKCRPPENRTPNAKEAANCLPYLTQQIALIQPKIIVCLGSVAAQTLIDPHQKISQMRGTWHVKNGIRYIATFHPAALLRDPSRKRPVWEDMKKVRDAYQKISGRRG